MLKFHSPHSHLSNADRMHIHPLTPSLHTTQWIGNHNFVLIGLAWQWSAAEQWQFRTDKWHTTTMQHSCSTTYKSISHDCDYNLEVWGGRNDKLLCFPNLLHVGSCRVNLGSSPVWKKLFRVCCSHTHREKTSYTQKATLRKNCEWGEKTRKCVSWPPCSSRMVEERSETSPDPYYNFLWVWLTEENCDNDSVMMLKVYNILTRMPLILMDKLTTSTRVAATHLANHILAKQPMHTAHACTQMLPFRTIFLSYNSLCSNGRKWTGVTGQWEKGNLPH